MDELLESLPLGQRLQRYRQSADEALRAAAASKDEDLRGEFLAAAARWHMLAAEVERAAARIAAPGHYMKSGDDN